MWWARIVFLGEHIAIIARERSKEPVRENVVC